MFDHVEAYHRPATIQEALQLIRRAGRGARFLAGATDIAVQADRSIRVLVDITGLGLNYIRRDGAAWHIGATTTMAELENSAAIRSFANGILAQAAATCGSVQNRNISTVGCNLANASPAADTATPLLALDAVLVLAASRGGRRRVRMADFFLGPHSTVLRGALLAEIEIPVLPLAGRSGWSFQKLGRTVPDIALVNVAAGLRLDRHGVCQGVRVALGAVAPRPMRARNAERFLAGEKPSDKLLDCACDLVAREVRPITDLRASAEYRREMSRVLARRALRECMERAC